MINKNNKSKGLKVSIIIFVIILIVNIIFVVPYIIKGATDMVNDIPITCEPELMISRTEFEQSEKISIHNAEFEQQYKNVCQPMDEDNIYFCQINKDIKICFQVINE